MNENLISAHNLALILQYFKLISELDLQVLQLSAFQEGKCKATCIRICFKQTNDTDRHKKGFCTKIKHSSTFLSA